MQFRDCGLWVERQGGWGAPGTCHGVICKDYKMTGARLLENPCRLEMEFVNIHNQYVRNYTIYDQVTKPQQKEEYC